MKGCISKSLFCDIHVMLPVYESTRNFIICYIHVSVNNSYFLVDITLSEGVRVRIWAAVLYW